MSDSPKMVEFPADKLRDTVHELSNIFTVIFGGLTVAIAKSSDEDQKRLLTRILEKSEQVRGVIASLQSQ